MNAREGGSVISGAFAAVGGQAVFYLLGIPTSILIARALGPDGRGEYYLPVLTGMVTMVVFQISLETAAQVAVSELRIGLDRLLRITNALALAVAAPALAAMIGFFFLTRSSVFEAVETHNFLIAAATVPIGIHMVWLSALQVIARRIARAQIALVASQAIYLVAAVVLYAAGDLSVTAVLILYAASSALGWLLNMIWARDFGTLRPVFEGTLLRRLAALGLRFHPAHLTMYLLFKVDVFLVSAILGVEAVGVYSLAVLLVDPLWVGTNALVQASVPFQLSQRQEDAARLAFKAARFNLGLTLAASALLGGSCWFVIPAVFGDAFQDSAAALALLLPGICALSAARPFMILLPRTGRAGTYAGIVVVALLVNLAMNVALLDELGVIGASIASTVGYGIIAAGFMGWGLRIADLRPGEALLPQPDDAATLRRVVARLRPATRS